MEGMAVNGFGDFFKGKTVLITGHTGFKGSWLTIWLLELGARVIGYGLDPYTMQDNFVVSHLKDNIIDIRDDIRNEKMLEKVFIQYQPEIVFHLAAQPLVRLSYKIPKETYEVNVLGTLNVLECIKKVDSVKVGILVTTDKCYENKEQIWGYREEDAMGGYDPYSSSKACAELLIASYRYSFFNPKHYKEHGKALSSVRAGNVIGGGDWSQDRLIPDAIRALMNNKTIEIRNKDAIRPWQHVLEPLYGYLILSRKMYLEGDKFFGAWNFGPDLVSTISVEQMIKCIIQKWGSGKYASISEMSTFHEATLLNLDCTKAKTYLNWYPKLSIEKRIDFTLQWYKNYLVQDVYQLCVEQINHYSSLEVGKK